MRPESAAAHEFAGEVRFRRGEFAEADAEFKTAVEWDPRFALAWWGLGRVAECTSMNKTAVEDFHRAYELNPNDPRILATWILRLRGQERIDAVKRYEAMLTVAGTNGTGEAQQLQELRQRAELAKALNGREVMALASPYKTAEIPLQAFRERCDARAHVRCGSAGERQAGAAGAGYRRGRNCAVPSGCGAGGPCASDRCHRARNR